MEADCGRCNPRRRARPLHPDCLCRSLRKNGAQEFCLLRPTSKPPSVDQTFVPVLSAFCFEVSFLMHSSTSSPGAPKGTLSSPQIVNPHFSRTRIEATLCFATWA